MRSAPFLILCLCSSLGSASITPFKPTTEEIRSLQTRAAQLGNQAVQQVLNSNLTFTWLDNTSFYYRRDTSPTDTRFTVYNTKSRQKSDLFNHAKFAEKLQLAAKETNIKPDRLPINVTRANQTSIFFSAYQKNWRWDRAAETISEVPQPSPIQGGEGQQSPDRQYRARIQSGQLQVKGNASTAEWMDCGQTTELARLFWSPDSKYIGVQSQMPGDRREVSVLDSTKAGPRAQLRTRLYDQPGDKLDTSETYFYNMATKKMVKADHAPVICGGHPWSNPPGMTWWTPRGQTGPTALIEFDIRGFQQKHVLEVNPQTGKSTLWVDEKSPTFIHLSQAWWRSSASTGSILFRSERDGWAHIYEYKKPGQPTQITRGNFVVRTVERLTDSEIIFSANGREAGDPYFIHFYKIKRDGTNLTHLTPAAGFHRATFSPDYSQFIDRSSTVSNAPTYTLRDSNGAALATIEESNEKPIRDAGIKGPVEFSAKGRDGTTDIYGMIHFPTHLDPNKSYPVIEDIYAGPHDSHVPKEFTSIFRNQRLAELGFIVVQIDGMGTANRGKKFHDVCWKNVADAGLPDRIAWIKAAAGKYPQMDISRVGIYGTSAGGQNSTGALLFHPEFYKVGVSSCGCHDNRMDKFWWNEQWMGYPVGPHYDEQSNITNAAKLQGQLLLMVGEVDSNVPPESTFRLLAELIRAKKNVDFVYLPGVDHTGGGEFGERKRRDFFVKHLLGVEPPTWN